MAPGHVIRPTAPGAGGHPTIPGARTQRSTRHAPPPHLELISPARGSMIPIDGDAKMPVIIARCRIAGAPLTLTATTAFTWRVELRFNAAHCPHGGSRVINHPDIVRTTIGGTFTIPFQQVRGGDLTIIVETRLAGHLVRVQSSRVKIVGTNPPLKYLWNALPHDTLRHIAKVESGARQFVGKTDGGTGPCPLFSGDNLGGVGLLQITVPKPTDNQVWSWRENVAKGIQIFNEKVAAARHYPSQIRHSHRFTQLVNVFNESRHKQKLAAIPVELPEFTTGDFNGNLQQLERDSIRGFNGWGGRDHFGFPLHEFRVALDAHGHLRVNLGAGGTKGTAIWEQVPARDRPQGFGDPNYVAHVLAATT